jgi:tRNA 2-(methylsulfanyl)-N6-isopentenyladenosine37 hydroxylase
MLNLAAPSSPAWLARALANLDELLLDHAHCEKKAASTAVSLLFRYPDRLALSRRLSALAREELAHFEQMVAVLEARGVPLVHLMPSPYAGELLQAVRPDEPLRLLDTLLCLSLIEARSCERMKLLADALPDPSLAALYQGLLASEARHHHAYVEMAETIAAPDEVRARLRTLAEHEATVIARAPAWAHMHT